MSPRFHTPDRRWRIILLVVALATIAAGIVYILTTRGIPEDVAIVPTPSPTTQPPALPVPGEQDPRLVPIPFPVREQQNGGTEPVPPSAPAGPAENALALVVISMVLGMVGLWHANQHTPS